MNKLAIALIAAATTTGIATAQTSRLEWRVDGNSAAVVNAGDTVLVEGFLSWDIQGVGLSSADYTITLDGADMTDESSRTRPVLEIENLDDPVGAADGETTFFGVDGRTFDSRLERE